MWTETYQESPLKGLKPVQAPAQSGDTKRLRIIERPFLDLAVLRGNACSSGFAGALERALGTAPPLAPNTVARGHVHLVAWMGPDEWWVQSLAPTRPALEGALRPALAGQSATVVDVSSGYTVLQLLGDPARDVLEKGCPLDLHPRVFAPGQCAQSHYFKAGVMLRALEARGVEVVVRRSFADYAGRMLLDAAREFMSPNQRIERA
ncbi:sarcosine oxidase subunit gamma [Achromobacter sp. AGC39]